MAPDASLLARFADDLDTLIPSERRLGVAVSGGPDSLALLLLAAAVRPGRVDAITIDHALRPESGDEAALVARICASLGVPHEVRAVEWGEKPASALQERARRARYALIAAWMRERGLQGVCTAHHRDDQAETTVMRLARGTGVRGLAAMRPSAPLPGADDLTLLRPLLGWRRSELAAICSGAGIAPAADPSNDDLQFERVRVRQQIRLSGLDAENLARSADHLRAADEAIDWAVERQWAAQVRPTKGGLSYEPAGEPLEIQRRIIVRILGTLTTEGPAELRGAEVDRLLESLFSGRTATLRGVKAEGGATWHFQPAPPRTLGCG
ncbi:MAG TPA: tRNA lysidine(34) synthetase TilS [Sphingomicrobium sp.]|nr:tRNA lysidine(34) synthetase TilS [Sphingomicrobium sp.]